eukprot:CAMPEP_0113938826 /NCGR_PEP_ID=MMETSP1339-20121228/5242_1 /TAXON_ID=94617 /ORGANISM="Fibrocapsa japonica" /LENGTH=344 /DNA_ID=CAMNT_0000942115 /DNA_START=43 /DNA_END=1077 /DNA_ORIENTATION=+ /assembly_acc=CAM_ASM_000762
MDLGTTNQTKYYGYKGFRSWSQQDLPRLPPGESDDTRAHKFNNVGHGAVYQKPIPNEDIGRRTNQMEASAALHPSEYRVPDRRGVSVNFKQTQARSKPFLATSTFRSSFRDFTTEVLNLSKYTEEEYREAFERIDTDGSNFINIREMKHLLTSVYGPDVPDFVLEKFMKFFDKNRDGRVSWEEFSSSLSTLHELVQHDVDQKRAGDPEWLSASKKVYPRVANGTMVRSSHQMDMGMPGSRGVLCETGAMLSTTKDLFGGTSKNTHHIPGYGGHIPTNTQNPDVVRHGFGGTQRGKHCDLRLYHQHNIPGYTGHKPVNPKNDLGERRAGEDRNTTSGAAALGLIL